MIIRTILISLMAIFLASTAVANTDDFPGRTKYPDVEVIEKQALLKKLNHVVVVDARSSLEFDTLRIKGALNIPVASKSFEDKLKSLRAKTNKTIVF